MLDPIFALNCLFHQTSPALFVFLLINLQLSVQHSSAAVGSQPARNQGLCKAYHQQEGGVAAMPPCNSLGDISHFPPSQWWEEQEVALLAILLCQQGLNSLCLSHSNSQSQLPHPLRNSLVWKNKRNSSSPGAYQLIT